MLRVRNVDGFNLVPYLPTPPKYSTNKTADLVVQVVEPGVVRHWEGGGGIRLLAILVHRIFVRHCLCSVGMPVLIMAVIFCAHSSHKRVHNAVTDCNRMGGRGL